MSEISKAYEPQSVEAKWYQFWLDQKLFVANPASPKQAYSIVIPPPNVTGVLTLGHVLNNTIQDILARKARMQGKEVLWLPGTDHAGIATQTVVERTLKKEGKIRHRDDLGREKFIEKVWEWKEKHGGIIIEQLKKLGCSCDWSRERFTMDPEFSRCTQKVFVDLYKKGMIYRGKRMVNWCPASQTALSDEEVIMKEQRGALYYFRVQVADHTTESRTATATTTGESQERNDASPSPGGEGRGEGVPASTAAAATVIGESQGRSDASPSPGGEGRGEGKAAAQNFGPVVDSEGRVWLTIATTRPETIPADTAVAVNPKDPRYAHLIGKHAIRALPPEQPREQRLIPIIGDEHVDFEFGTGVLKVTPAHDKNDFEIGLRHKLPIIEAINADGTMSDAAGVDLRGLDRFKARKVAAEKLKELGTLEKEEPYTNNVGFSERADVPIEPRLSEQWFLKYPAVEQSKSCVEHDEKVGLAVPSEPRRDSAATPGQKMRFYPQRWAKVYDHWMENIHDWCISRQLWWGHRIPVWTKKITTTKLVGFGLGEGFAESAERQLASQPNNSCVRWHGALTTVVESRDSMVGNFAVFDLSRVENGFQLSVSTILPDDIELLGKRGFTQDPDVLDTWFSSWLWPFATMGWPEQTETLKRFYPTTDLVTGPDIIFLWVARMIMAGYEFTGEMPFHNVYFTGIIRDKQGRKMSKSLGNSPDPLDLISKFGADALRFGVMRSAPLGQDILFDEQHVELGRNFCNKLWNACRFRQMQGGPVQGEMDPKLLTIDDKWILLKLHAAIREITDSLAEYKFSEATQTLYRFFWSEYCDWYVEATKAVLHGTDEPRKANTTAVIDFVLSHTLRLFHPFLPFITEELWHGMGYHDDMPADQGGQTIMLAPWPKPLEEDFRGFYGLDDCYLDMANARYELVTQGRNLRREANVPSNKKAKFVLKPAGHVSPHDAAVLKILLNADPFDLDPNYTPGKGTPVAHSPIGDLYLPQEGPVDTAAEKARLSKELEKFDAEILKVEQKLANPAFTQKVPPAVLQDHQKRLTDWQSKKAQVLASLAALEG